MVAESNSMDRDRELIRLIQGGAKDAFADLVERYKDRALSIAYSFTGDYEDAKNISQEAFLKAYLSIPKFRGGSSFYTWFYRILINTCKDHIRKKSGEGSIFSPPKGKEDEEGTAQDIFETESDSNPNPQDELLNKEMNEKITRAINSLPANQRIAFVLKHIHGMSIDEISTITRCAPGTVKSRLYHAVMKLQVGLGSYYKKGEYK
ncbi:MAG: sigma-70 family RNA polymerase sigma factor [Deltaproteobacteria bacterium]|nr:sigma-70 family RNA polymerase sigma factor [Deltaproteobacteria bacterium]